MKRLRWSAPGAARAGITALLLALAPPVVQRERRAILPADLHAPLRQRLVVLELARDTARRIFPHPQSAPARERLRRHGFDLP
ncbi:MAG: hypothetical protein H7322_15460 [Ramlibacter sp.]|nr:hypothetical protein [Ramlibacter sp.]